MSGVVGLLPRRDELVDAGFSAALTLLGLYGFKAAYGGTAYLALGALGLGVGLVLAYATARTRAPVLAVVLGTAAAALLLSGAVLEDTAVGGVLPSPESVAALAGVVVTGWKDLLTTVRPVGEAGDLLALPYLLGLVAGVASLSLARRVRPLAAPLLPPAVVAALSILLGPTEPAAAFVQGVGLFAVALAWVAVRESRERISLVRSSRRLYRPAAGGLVLVLAGAGAWYAAPHAPGAQAHERTVLEVVPPFDPSAFRSPLSGFRQYGENVPNTASLSDVVVVSTTGLEPGETVRLGTLDAYDGLVWGASNRARSGDGEGIGGFARVGSTLPPSGAGPVRTVRLTVGPAYDREVWLPTVGAPQAISFEGPRREQLEQSLRYSLGTATGVEPGGLSEGDVVVLEARATPEADGDQLPTLVAGGSSLLPSEVTDPVRAVAEDRGGDGLPMERVAGIATWLRTEGAYSDGTASAVPSAPGHGTGRLITFLQGTQTVGDDEQYAAAMALMANAVGVPARVVVQGTVREDRTVRGSDVSVGVEVDVAGQGWTLLRPEVFLDREREPDVPPQVAPPQPAPRLVPPPLEPLLSTADALGEAQSTSGQDEGATASGGGGFSIPGPLKAAATYAGPPLLLLAAVVGVVLGLKARRRSRRRTRGPVSSRVAAGWTEVLDGLRDHGISTPGVGTRREQARALSGLPVEALARTADEVVFGPGEPGPEVAERYWAQVDEARRAMGEGKSRVQRWRAALSLRSLAARPSLPGAPA